MVQRHDILPGSPRLNYLTLPTTLQDSDYEKFLGAMEEFLNVYAADLALLSEETKGGAVLSEGRATNDRATNNRLSERGFDPDGLVADYRCGLLQH